jgi:hypothetical protein
MVVIQISLAIYGLPPCLHCPGLVDATQTPLVNQLRLYQHRPYLLAHTPGMLGSQDPA